MTLPPPQQTAFISHETRCAALRWRPTTNTHRGTCVVLGQGFSLTMHDGLEPYAQAFAAAGAHVLAFDYRGFGGSSGQPRSRFRVREQRADWRAALAAARGLDGVRADHVVAWGFSFGGGHVTALAAGGEPLAAAIVLCPLVDGLARALSANRCSAARVLPAAIRDALGWHALVPVTGTPGARAAMTLPGEVEGFSSVVGERSDWRPQISPQVLLQLPFLRPVRRARCIPTPLWVGLADHDVTVAANSVERLAREAPYGELHRLGGAHFAPLVRPLADDVAAKQVEFLRRLGLL